MSRGPAVVLWALLLPVLASGCAMMDSGRNWWTGKRTDQSEPELSEDTWAFVGKEARGARPREQADWFERYLWSEKARDINRNFGFD
jgi:hypothetical protein